VPRPMTDGERRAFLLAPGRTGHLATVRADGRPHVAPVWFTLDGDDVVFNTHGDTVKGRNLRRTGRASLSVDLPAMPYAFVHLAGPVTLEDDPEAYRPLSRRIAQKYVPFDEVDAFTDRNAVPGELLVRLTPETVVAVADMAGWD
jgi:PPOX class probable F420-dependent enzyme